MRVAKQDASGAALLEGLFCLMLEHRGRKQPSVTYKEAGPDFGRLATFAPQSTNAKSVHRFKALKGHPRSQRAFLVAGAMCGHGLVCVVHSLASALDRSLGMPYRDEPHGRHSVMAWVNLIGTERKIGGTALLIGDRTRRCFPSSVDCKAFGLEAGLLGKRKRRREMRGWKGSQAVLALLACGVLVVTDGISTVAAQQPSEGSASGLAALADERMERAQRQAVGPYRWIIEAGSAGTASGAGGGWTSAANVQLLARPFLPSPLLRQHARQRRRLPQPGMMLGCPCWKRHVSPMRRRSTSLLS